MKKILLSVIILGLSFSLFAARLTYHHSFAAPRIMKIGKFQKVEFDNTVQLGKTGEPSFPYLGIKLLLPQGESAVKINVIKNDKIRLKEEYTLFPVQPNQKISDSTGKEFVPPNPQIYSKNTIYPENEIYNFTTQYLAGFSICFVAITPL